MKELNGTTLASSELDGRRTSVPVLHVRGSHYDVGYDVGRNFASIIKSFVTSYNNLRDFEREHTTEAGRRAYETTLANMKKRFPYYVKEMQGVANGANVSFTQLFLLQMDDLIGTVNDNQIPRKDTGGCSSIAINNFEDTILGHTEDAFGETMDHFYILSAHIIPTPEDRELGATEERFSSLCYAGHLPGYTMGYNQHGLVFSINTLSLLTLKFGATPRTFLTRKLLSARNQLDAERILRDEGLGAGNGFSVNMIWSDANGGRRVLNAEIAPDFTADRSVLSVQNYDKDPLVHVNLYQRLRVNEVIGSIIDSSEARMRTIHSYAPPRTRAEVIAILSDDKDPEFQLFQQQKGSVIKTIAVGIFDMNRRCWSIYIEKPSESEPVAVLPIRFPALDDIY